MPSPAKKYTRIQFLPHSKHTASPLTRKQKLSKESLFIVRILRNRKYTVWVKREKCYRYSNDTDSNDCFFCKGPRSRCYGCTAALRLIVQPVMKMTSVFFRFTEYWSTGRMKLTGKNRSTRVKTCPSATLSTTDPTWTDPGSNPGLRIEMPATNRLSHGTA